MKLRKQANSICAIIIILLLFALPQSSNITFYNDGSEIIDLFKKFRLVLIPLLPVTIILYRGKIFLSCNNFIKYGLVVLVFLLNIIVNHTINAAILYMLTCFILFDIFCYADFDYVIIRRILCFSLLMLIIYSSIFIGKAERRAGSWLDPNLAGYFYFMLFYYFWNINKRLFGLILILLGVMTFSRLFLLAVLVYIGINLLRPVLYKIHLNIYILFFVSFLVIIVVSHIYVQLFEQNYILGYDNSFSRFRLSGLFDESNYFRCYSNLIYFDNLTFGRLFWGYDKDLYKTLQTIRTPILPHNLILSLLVSFGAIITLIYLSYFNKIYRNYKNWDLGFVCGLLLYYLFLGVSSYYGIDLLIQLLLVKSIAYDNGRQPITPL